ncbi:hypothetical protein CLOM_g3616 [Closterium sp. NIES-68]|nr:hypothetical protein CLOM_g3616 [Closterium sp. NIES-68]
MPSLQGSGFPPPAPPSSVPLSSPPHCLPLSADSRYTHTPPPRPHCPPAACRAQSPAHHHPPSPGAQESLILSPAVRSSAAAAGAAAAAGGGSSATGCSHTSGSIDAATAAESAGDAGSCLSLNASEPSAVHHAHASACPHHTPHHQADDCDSRQSHDHCQHCNHCTCQQHQQHQQQHQQQQQQQQQNSLLSGPHQHCYMHNQHHIHHHHQHHQHPSYHYQQQARCHAPSSSPAVCYRDIGPNDMDDLKALHEATFPIVYEAEFYDNVVHHRGIISWGAVDPSQPGRLIGFITARLVPPAEAHGADVLPLTPPSSWHIPAPTLLYILTLGVAKPYRKAGVASHLVHLLLSHASSLTHCAAVYLHVVSYNTSAIRFYRSLHFVFLRYLPRFYYLEDGYYDAFLFARYVNGWLPPAPRPQAYRGSFELLQPAVTAASTAASAAMSLVCARPSTTLLQAIIPSAWIFKCLEFCRGIFFRRDASRLS